MSEGEFKKRIAAIWLETRGWYVEILPSDLWQVLDEARKEFPDEDDSKFDTWENEDEMNIFNPDDYIKAVKEWLLRYFGGDEKK